VCAAGGADEDGDGLHAGASVVDTAGSLPGPPRKESHASQYRRAAAVSPPRRALRHEPVARTALRSAAVAGSPQGGRRSRRRCRDGAVAAAGTPHDGPRCARTHGARSCGRAVAQPVLPRRRGGQRSMGRPQGGPSDEETGGVLLSRALAGQVPSALRGLTALFGMGRGVSPSPSPPENGESPRGPFKTAQ
jgi:hypothetical protein